MTKEDVGWKAVENAIREGNADLGKRVETGFAGLATTMAENTKVMTKILEKQTEILDRQDERIADVEDAIRPITRRAVAATGKVATVARSGRRTKKKTKAGSAQRATGELAVAAQGS